MKTAIKGQNGTAKLKQAMMVSNNCQLGFSRQMKEVPGSIYFPATLSFHTAIWRKAGRKQIDVICFTHFPPSNKTLQELLL